MGEREREVLSALEERRDTHEKAGNRKKARVLEEKIDELESGNLNRDERRRLGLEESRPV